MIRGVKGEDGKEGKQGPMGPPCAGCGMSFCNLIRFIYEDGNYSISDYDVTIVVSCDSECVLYLPEIPKNIKEFQTDIKDYYIRYQTKKFVIQKGHHMIRTLEHTKDLINDSYYYASLTPNKIYDAIPTKDGWIILSGCDYHRDSEPISH